MWEDIVETRFKLTRLVRTQSSEIYLVWDGDKRIGQIDIHYAHDTVHATVIFEADLSVGEEEELLAQIDDDVVFILPARDLNARILLRMFFAEKRLAGIRTAPAPWMI